MRTLLNKFLLVVLFFPVTIAFGRISDEDIRNMESSLVINRIDNSDIEVEMPGTVFTFQEAEIRIKFKDDQHPRLLLNNNVIDFIVDGEEQKLTFTNGEAVIKHKFDKNNTVSIYAEDFSYQASVMAYPLWVLIVPVVFIALWLMRGIFIKKKQA